jgi:hypothetical protein
MRVVAQKCSEHIGALETKIQEMEYISVVGGKKIGMLPLRQVNSEHRHAVFSTGNRLASDKIIEKKLNRQDVLHFKEHQLPICLSPLDKTNL